MVTSKNRLAEIRGQFEFLACEDPRGARIMEVKPLIGSRWFTKESIVLEWMIRIARETV